MSAGIAELAHDPIAALLGSDSPDVVYFARRDLCAEPVEPIVANWEGEAAQLLLSKQRNDGSWRGKKPENPVYPENHSDLLETFKRVRLLVERHELTQDHPAMASAAEYLFSFQSAEGDIRGFIGNQYATYYTGYVLSLLIRAGFAADARVDRGLQWLLSMRQDDGGWTIPILTHSFDRETGYQLTATFTPPVEPDRTKPFSHNWTDMVLRAFAAHPGYRSSPEALHAAGLLKSQFFCPDAYTSYQHPRYWTRFGFWWPNLLTALESLAEFGFVRSDTDVERGYAWFVANQADDGLWNITNDDTVERDTPTNRKRRAWLGLRVCRLLTRLS